MATKFVIVAFALLVGCMAVPTPEQNVEDNSMWFQTFDTSARIVGGSLAATGSHPHMVALTSGRLIKSLLCGGSLVSTRTVLTAAHCIEGVYSRGSLNSNLRVVVGTNRWNSGGQAYSVSRNVTHSHYVSRIIKNDIGLLITSTEVAITNLVRPIPLTYDEISSGVSALVAGWGKVSTNGRIAAALLEVNVATIDGQQCVTWAAQSAIDLNIRNAPPVEPHLEICTFHAPGFGTCNGDSGSALARTSDGNQIGIVSWGFPCARGAPDMFVRVSAYRDFLEEHIV